MATKMTISKSGYDAGTEVDVNNYIFHSDYNTFKILSEGTLSSQTVTANPTTFSVAHGQGAVPAVMAFIDYPDGYVTVPRGIPRDTTSSYLGVVNSRYWNVEIDSTYIYFLCYKGTTSNHDVNIKYYVFEAPGD